jgi:glycerate kinase
MASVLGYRFLDSKGRNLPEGGKALSDLDRIDTSGRDARIDHTIITAACDVTNPFTGPEGAALVFGPQKGGTPATLAALDSALAHLARIVLRDCGIDIADVPGAGAAGGLGGGVVAFLHGVLTSGIEVVLEAVHFDDRLRDADLVLTGEGRIDDQTRMGKVIDGILRRTAPRDIPVIAVTGSTSFKGTNWNALPGLTELVTLVGEEISVDRAMKEASSLVRERTREVLRRHLCS